MPLTNKITIDAYIHPTFAFDTADNQWLVSWYNDATHYFVIDYYADGRQWLLGWQDGGTFRYMLSSAYTDSDALDVWMQLTACVDLTTGSTAGSALYVNRVAVDTTWSGNIDAMTSTFPVMWLRHNNGTAGAFKINYLRIFPSYCASAAEVAANFKTVKNEEIVFHMDGHSMGRTRCNVTGRVSRLDLARSVESPAGRANPNEVSIELMSPAGQFADDQYAAFTPASEIYNGTAAQAYMQNRSGVEVETWYGNVPELEFVGRIDDSLFKRRSGANELSKVTVTASDMVYDLRRRVRQKGYAYEDYEIANISTTTTSLLHVVGKMGTQAEGYNFIANAGFENTTVANSWTVAGTSATLTRAAGGMAGSYEGAVHCSSGTGVASMSQTITFAGTKKLNVGQDWTAAIYARTFTTARTATLTFEEYTSGSTSITSTSLTQTLGADGGWLEMTKTIVISTSATNTLKLSLSHATVGTVSFDCASLIQNDTSLLAVLANNSDGASGVFNADNATTSTTWDTAGYDVDDAMITHPWARVEAGQPVMDILGDIADATAARYIGMDACGTVKYRTPFRSGYYDPAALFAISSCVSVDAVMSIEQANKIAIHGDNIAKSTSIGMVWEAIGAGFPLASGSQTQLALGTGTIANGATWPSAVNWPPYTDAATYVEYWAKYGETG